MAPEIVPAFSTLARQFTTLPIYLWDHFYFQSITPELYQQATDLARRISQISRGRRTLLLSENADTIGKIGEFVVRDYCQSQLTLPWESLVEKVNPHGGDLYDLMIGEKRVDVKTRQLHVDVTIAPNFDLRVPETEVQKPMDLFILAGYCPNTRYGYVLGWCSWEEMSARPIRTDIRFPAKCVPLLDLHPMAELERFITG